MLLEHQINKPAIMQKDHKTKDGTRIETVILSGQSGDMDMRRYTVCGTLFSQNFDTLI